ncbi:MAG TPA: 50S ribosomal protein L24 [Candidatus Saccharimonadales bacterium]|nr:50S ribosomal protein L24 [Candidatus Saccharimonadales bacterium]
MAQRIKKDDVVKIISGSKKGTTGKVLAVLPGKGALVEGVGTKHRHVKPSQANPRGGSKDIHVPTPLHKLAVVVDEKAGKTSRVGYVKNADGAKIRLARQAKNKEIK